MVVCHFRVAPLGDEQAKEEDTRAKTRYASLIVVVTEVGTRYGVS